jgi:hypothetical protein
MQKLLKGAIDGYYEENIPIAFNSHRHPEFAGNSYHHGDFITYGQSNGTEAFGRE